MRIKNSMRRMRRSSSPSNISDRRMDSQRHRWSHRRCPPPCRTRGGGGRLRAASLLLHVSVGRAASLTLGGIQYLENDNLDDLGDGYVDNGCRKGG